MRSYKPEKLFTKEGKLIPELKALAPTGNARMSANPITNGGQVRKNLLMPRFQDYAYKIKQNGVDMAPSMNIFATFLADIVKQNMHNFRLFGPDETQSNKLDAVYAVSKKQWMAETLEYDDDGGNLATSGRTMEILSEHTCEGMYSQIA